MSGRMFFAKKKDQQSFQKNKEKREGDIKKEMLDGNDGDGGWKDLLGLLA